MAEDGVVFTDRAAARIADATRWVEQERQRLILQPGPAAETTAEFSFARVTGAVDGSGNYPAIVTAYDPTIGSFHDYGSIRLRPANGETLVVGTRYACRAVGLTPAGARVYLTGPTAPSGGGGGTVPFNGVRLSMQANPIVSGGVQPNLSPNVG